MENNDNYTFKTSHLVVLLADVKAQNATILRILTKDFTDEQKKDYDLFMEFSRQNFISLALQATGNVEGATVKKLISEVEELKKSLKGKNI